MALVGKRGRRAVVGLWAKAPGRITPTERVTAGECKKKRTLTHSGDIE